MTLSHGLNFLKNGGETGSLIQRFNWADTPLGPMESWSQSLRVALQILISSRFPMQILWGSDYIQFYNDAYIPIAGSKHPTGIGQRAADCWQEVWDFSGPLLDRVVATGEATWSEDQPLVLNRGGQAEEGFFTFSYTPIWDESGQVGGIFIAVNETTQQIVGARRERALRDEAQAVRESLENVLTSISDEFMMFDVDWCFTYVNDRAASALQKPRQDLLGQSIWVVFPEATATPFYRELHGAVAAQTVTSFEQFCPDQERWLENRVYPFGNGVSLLRVDITDRKNLEQALQTSEEQLDSLLNTAPASIARCRFFADRTYILDYRSVGCEALTGYALSEITPELWKARTFAEDWAANADPMFDAVFEQRPITVEYRFRHKDGSVRWISDSLTSRRAEAQDTWIVTMVGIDITARKQLEDERAHLLAQERLARKAAENANRIKDEFLAVLSHELRSPLNPILGWAKLLRTTQLSEAKTAYALETIERNARLQSQLIDDLLDVSRILRGKLVLHSLPTSLTAVIQDALETVRSVGDAKGVAIQTQLKESPFKVLGDANRLKQVVWNLLSNAVKFTPKGGQVTVQLDYTDHWANVRVSDTGKGIDPAFLPHVFDRFRQADSTTTRDFGGLGLGLAIAHQIVDMHHGTIQAESLGEGQGATFIVRLPVTLSAASADITSPASVHDLHDIHVMVVEDDSDSRHVITAALQQFGANVTALASGAEAIAALGQIQPDILVSDIGMPGMDGYMLMQQIRDMTQPRQMPAIALTAYTTEIDQQKILSAGFQKHLSKPMELAQLIEAVSSLVQNPTE